jgi:hypothetical protein
MCLECSVLFECKTTFSNKSCTCLEVFICADKKNVHDISVYNCGDKCSC